MVLAFFFTEVREGRVNLAQVSTEGTETAFIDTSFRFPRMSDISRDRSQLLVLGFTGSELESSIWTMPTLGGTARRVGDLQAHDATWSPHGDIVYANGSDLYLAKADGSGTHKFVTVAGIPFWLRWAPDGSVLRFHDKRLRNDCDVTVGGFGRREQYAPIATGVERAIGGVLWKLES